MNRPSRAVRGMRKALSTYWRYKLDWLLQQGDFDPTIEDFLKGNALTITVSVNMIVNDVVMFQALMGEKDLPDKTMQKVRREWKKERIKVLA